MLSVSGVALLLAVWCFARIGYQGRRGRSERQLLATTGLDDPRSNAEKWLGDRGPKLLLIIGIAALLVALVAGVLGVVAAVIV